MENNEKSSYKFIIFDVSNTQIPEVVKEVYTDQIMSGKNNYEVWIEGYVATGESGEAYRLNLTNEINTLWKGDIFKDACINAMKSLGWELKGYYDKERNSYWACRFYNNEKDARKSFG